VEQGGAFSNEKLSITELAKDFPPNFPGKLTLSLTTIRNFNTKTSSTPSLNPVVPKLVQAVKQIKAAINVSK